MDWCAKEHRSRREGKDAKKNRKRPSRGMVRTERSGKKAGGKRADEKKVQNRTGRERRDSQKVEKTSKISRLCLEE